MVELEWTAGEVLALRTAFRMSRPEFARLVGVTKRTVLAWESTVDSQLRLSSRRLLDAALADADDDVVSRFHWQLISEKTSPEPGSLLQPQLDAAAATLVESANQSAALLAWAEASNVGALTIEDMQADLRSATRAYLREPTLPLFERVVAVRDKAIGLLSGRQKPSHTPQLYGIVGWALSVLGWITVDLGQPNTAEKHLRTAWAMADNADDNDLRAWVRASQHTAAFWREDYDQAAAYAEDGLRYARYGTSALFLASARALDLALTQQKIEASSALDLAVDIGAELAEAPRHDVLVGPFTCSPSPARALVSRFAPTLAEIPTMAPVPADGLHITVQGIGFTDEVTAFDVERIVAAARRRLAVHEPFPLRCGPPIVDKETIQMPIGDLTALVRIREHLQAAIGEVWSPDNIPERGDTFRPHLTLAYSTGSASIVEIDNRLVDGRCAPGRSNQCGLADSAQP